jgi:hypothetical protein
MGNGILNFLVAVLLAACVSRQYYTYSGSPVYTGTGGASKNVNGIDLWVTGSPPRKFMIIGYIEDSRPNRGIPLLTMQADMVKQAKQAGVPLVLFREFKRCLPSGEADRVLVTGRSPFNQRLRFTKQLTTLTKLT